MAKRKADKEVESLDPRIRQIGARIRELRIQAGYSNYENFAYEKGINRVQYGSMEKGTNFTIKSLLKVIDAHGITVEEFFKDL